MNNEQKNKSIKVIIAFLLALGLTVFLYWPIYQKVSLSNQNTNIDQEVNRLDLPLSEDIKELLSGSIQLPLDRHELCLKNRNGFHFIHADSDSPGVPFVFYTNDLNQHEFGKVNKLGAMAITFYYQDNSSETLLYREFKQQKGCVKLEVLKLRKYASSTIEYSYVGLKRMEKLDLGKNGKLAILRSLVKGYYIDTSKSSVFIIARWKFFLSTFAVLFGFFLWLIKYIQKTYGLKRSNNMANI